MESHDGLKQAIDSTINLYLDNWLMTQDQYQILLNQDKRNIWENIQRSIADKIFTGLVEGSLDAKHIDVLHPTHEVNRWLKGRRPLFGKYVPHYGILKSIAVIFRRKSMALCSEIATEFDGSQRPDDIQNTLTDAIAYNILIPTGKGNLPEVKSNPNFFGSNKTLHAYQNAVKRCSPKEIPRRVKNYYEDL